MAHDITHLSDLTQEELLDYYFSTMATSKALIEKLEAEGYTIEVLASPGKDGSDPNLTTTVTLPNAEEDYNIVIERNKLHIRLLLEKDIVANDPRAADYVGIV